VKWIPWLVGYEDLFFRFAVNIFVDLGGVSVTSILLAVCASDS
jgi:hypothetical protein